MSHPPLTDAELIELVGSKSPSELTADEVDALRARLRESEELRVELIDHLHMEAYLHAALGDFRVSVDDLAARVEETRRVRRRRFTRYGFGLGLLFAVVLAGGAWYVATRPEPNVPGDDEKLAANDDPAVDPTDVDPPGGNDPTVPAPDPDDPVPPMDPVDDDPGEPWSVVLEAEEYVHSNLEVDTEAYGKGIGVLVEGRESPRFAEWVVEPPRAGVHQLELRYASDESRPLVLSINGEPIREDAAGADTGAWDTERQRAFVAARVELPAGRTTIRLEGERFPHLDKLAVVEVREADGAIHDGDDLPPLVLRDAVERPSDPAPEIPSGPWARTLAADFEPLPFEEVCLDPLRPEPFERFSESTLKAWFEAGPGGWKTKQETTYSRLWAGFEGTARLRAPWPADAAMRLSLVDVHHFEMQFWNGERGVVLRADTQRRPGLWCGYAAEREPGKAGEDDYVLLTTDSARHQRTEFGTIELRWQAGELVMTRGETRLLTVPLDAPPAEVLWKGRVGIRGLTMFRSTPVPATEPSPRAIVQSIDRPAELDWGAAVNASGQWSFTSVKEAAEPTWSVPTFPPGLDESARPKVQSTLTGHPDGVVELTVERSEWTVHAAARIDEPGLHEFVFRVEGAEPGTGVFLGDATGRPLDKLGFFSINGNDGALGFRIYSHDDQTQADNVHGYHQPWPYAGAGQWFRVVRGFDTVKLFVSGDGIHWGQVEHRGLTRPAEAPTTIGLFCHRTDKPKSIRLRMVEVREFSGLVELANDDVRTRVDIERLLAESPNYDQWFLRLVESQPVDVPFDEWRTACAVRSLERFPNTELTESLLASLVAEAVDSRPVNDCFDLLDDVATLWHHWPGDRVARLTDRYVDVGRRLMDEGSEAPLATTLQRWIAAPLWTDAKLDPEFPEFARDVVVTAAFAGDWESVARQCLVRRFHQTPGHPVRMYEQGKREEKTVFPWAEVVARRSTDRPVDPDLPGFEPRWRHPLVSQLTKEAYNVMGEFESALAAGAFEDACAIVTSTDENGALGLLPDARDPRLLVSMPRAIGTAMAAHPELRDTMRETYGPVARLRVREAMSRGDAATVEAATRRYLGTEAAASARAWLGDRALAAGNFVQAVEHYRAAVESAPDSERPSIEPRRRLAEAMLGLVPDEPLPERVRLGEGEIDVATFQRMLEETASRSSSGATLIGEPADEPNGGLPTGFYRTEVRGRFDGEVGQNVGKELPGGVDWAGRQLAVVRDGDLMIASNRFRVIAYRANDGSRAWATGLGGEQGHAHEWTLAPFRPLVVGSQIFVRRLTKDGAELACLDRGNGKVLWRTDPNPEFASDPVLLDGRLLAVMVREHDRDAVTIELVSVHPATGEILLRAPLLQQRNVWNGMPPCSLVATDSRVVCAVGASLVCADGTGEVQWVRRQPWLPIGSDERWPRFHEARPIVANGVIHVAVPHTYLVGAYEVSGGRTIWETTDAGPGEVLTVDADAGITVVRTDDGFRGLRSDDGTSVWSVTTDQTATAAWVAGGMLTFVDMLDITTGRPKRTPALVWVELRDGTERGRCPLTELSTRSPQIGPVVATGDETWVFHGPDQREPTRDLVRLVRDSDHDLPSPGDGPLADIAVWEPRTTAAVRDALDTVIPGWLVISGETFGGGSPIVRADRGLQEGFAGTRATPGRPALLTRQVDVPDGSAALQVAVMADGGPGWRLRVLVDGTEIATEDVPTDWRDVRVDLGEYAGRSVRLTLVHEVHESGKGEDARWRGLAIE